VRPSDVIPSPNGHPWRLGLSVALVVGSGCGAGSAAPPEPEQRTVAGVYALTHVDGAPVPVSPDAGECTDVVTDGSLMLVPRNGETRPLYTLIVSARPGCIDFLTEPAAHGFVVDAGNWRFIGSAIGFASARGRGGYEGTVVDRGSPPVLRTIVDGREFRWRQARRSGESPVTLTVGAQAGAGRTVDGVYLEMRSANGLVSRGGTNGGRPFGAGVSPGVVSVRFAPPPGFAAAPGQPNPVEVAVSPDGSAVLTLQLVPTSS
jgi:hypothetical protein